MTVSAILAVNCGSSSLKLTAYANDGAAVPYAAAAVERVGLTGARLSVSSGHASDDIAVHASDMESALDAALNALDERKPIAPAAIGHRIVHGGVRYSAPVHLTRAIVADLRQLVPLDPIHMKPSLAVVDATARRYPDVPQFACFDTAFHRTMPTLAQRYPLPDTAADSGVRRYGFHGLSCESILDALRAIDPSAAGGRLLIAHLGNGASVTAVRAGASVDTTMGFSPIGGLMMGTRSGDLDPGVITYLARTRGCDPDVLERLVGSEAGLLGVSGFSSDMREVLAHSNEPRARAAIELYCYIARKHIGALTAVLNGIDALVFTGGIGAHAGAIRAGICDGLEYAGIVVDRERNAAGPGVISPTGSRVTVRAMETDEDLMIARHVRQLLMKERSHRE